SSGVFPSSRAMGSSAIPSPRITTYFISSLRSLDSCPDHTDNAVQLTGFFLILRFRHHRCDKTEFTGQICQLTDLHIAEQRFYPIRFFFRCSLNPDEEPAFYLADIHQIQLFTAPVHHDITVQ